MPRPAARRHEFNTRALLKQRNHHGGEHAGGKAQHHTYTVREQTDFGRIFTQEMNGLYLLSLLLTADREKAEQCFVSGLEDSVEGNPVFKEWARSWAQRTIIQNAVKVIHPHPAVLDYSCSLLQFGDFSLSKLDVQRGQLGLTAVLLLVLSTAGCGRTRVGDRAGFAKYLDDIGSKDIFRVGQGHAAGRRTRRRLFKTGKSHAAQFCESSSVHALAESLLTQGCPLIRLTNRQRPCLH
jgi:hypothetical protein